MATNVFVYIDHFNGQAVGAAWEIVAAGRKAAEGLGGGVTAVVVGQGIAALADEAIKHGADDALVAEAAALKDYRVETYASVLSKLLKDERGSWRPPSPSTLRPGSSPTWSALKSRTARWLGRARSTPGR
jgi:electron transfer flavoprotein alpha subunit